MVEYDIDIYIYIAYGSSRIFWKEVGLEYK